MIEGHLATRLTAPVRRWIYPTSVAGDVLFMMTDAMDMLVDEPTALAENVPEQRLGTRVPREMIDFLSAHLPAEPGMVGGLASFASVANVQSVTFTNAELTQARAAVRTFSNGGSLMLEKQAGAWRVVGVAGTYVN